LGPVFSLSKMPTSLSPTDICNLALSEIGAANIQSMTDMTNTSAIACNTNFQLAYLEVSRVHLWNCILQTAQLAEIPQTPIAGNPTPSPTVAWAPLTTYPALVYLSYSGGIYQTQYIYKSTNNFLNDLTTGALVQADYDSFNAAFGGFSGSQYPSGWNHQYALPSDFVLLAILNDNSCWNSMGQGSQYEIIGNSIFTNASQAIIKYVQNVADTTRFDPLFVAALVQLLASKLATILRLDGGNMAKGFLGVYERKLNEARTRDAGEGYPRRFNPMQGSNWVKARWGGLNG